MIRQINQCMLGHEQHDAVHADLIDKLQTIIRLIRSGEPHDDEIEALKVALKLHFFEEGRGMQKMPNYPLHKQEAHIRDHNKILDMLDTYLKRPRIGNSFAYSATVLEHLFCDHIQQFDSEYVEFERNLKDISNL